VRNQKIPAQSPTLDTLGKSLLVIVKSETNIVDEAFTSENWIVRIYAVKKEDSLGREHKAVTAFDGGKKLGKSPSAVDGASSSTGKKRPST
jgi:dolichyl-diphosphooligosaccharide--protein glycosyltransferase